MNWNADADQVIIENHSLKSAAQIGLLLGVTRNAIIGRSRRLGLPKLSTSPSRTSPISRPRRVNGEKKIRKAPVREFASPPVPVAPLNISFIDLEPHHCREIIGSAGAGMSLSCGHPVITDSSYCRWHHSINYSRA